MPIFAHRGLVTKNSSQNTIASLEAAYKDGFRAIEFDLWYLNHEIVNRKIVIKHDEPQGETLPFLRDFFHFGNELIYWLDFKNLNLGNAKEAFEFVSSEVNRAGIDYDKIFLIPFETNYELAGFFCDKAREVFGRSVQFGAVCKEAEKIADLEKFCATKEVKFLSIHHHLIDQSFIKKFSAQTIFAWTIKDKKTFAELRNLGIENFASDLALTELL